MFLRRNRKTVDNVSYDYWTLCESVRTAAGPRQRVVASLGKLTPEDARSEAGWEDLRAVLEGRPAARQPELGEKPALICFLALAKWRVLEQWMSGKVLGTCARKLVAEISRIKINCGT